jgi:hypothetical protein
LNGGARKSLKLAGQAFVGEPGRRCATDHDQIDSRAQRRTTRAKPLPNPALHTIAHDSVADLATDCDSQPSVSRRIRGTPSLGADHDERRTRDAATPMHHLLKFHGTPQTIDRLETAGLRRHRYFDGVETAMRLRPLARRRFKTLRPAAVDMRLRKPWTRLRLIRLG